MPVASCKFHYHVIFLLRFGGCLCFVCGGFLCFVLFPLVAVFPCCFGGGFPLFGVPVPGGCWLVPALVGMAWL